MLGGERFETSRVLVSYRKSDSVEVIDEAKVPEKYKRVEIKTTLDKVPAVLREWIVKTEIAKADAKKELKAKRNIDGLALETKNNIQIK